eukprot:TRINITY_DN50_c0_g2_i2.p1 TRINITY_DN50_c0_g2~~TRINITY_DN50_c0_g2_i2.p1  ORF type:complete len:595 (-),score=101.22 TRINITY_DN50_c0_g2_i2:655-2439(-)
MRYSVLDGVSWEKISANNPISNPFSEEDLLGTPWEVPNSFSAVDEIYPNSALYYISMVLLWVLIFQLFWSFIVMIDKKKGDLSFGVVSRHGCLVLSVFGVLQLVGCFVNRMSADLNYNGGIIHGSLMIFSSISIGAEKAIILMLLLSFRNFESVLLNKRLKLASRTKFNVKFLCSISLLIIGFLIEIWYLKTHSHSNWLFGHLKIQNSQNPIQIGKLSKLYQSWILDVGTWDMSWFFRKFLRVLDLIAIGYIIYVNLNLISEANVVMLKTRRMMFLKLNVIYYTIALSTSSLVFCIHDTFHGCRIEDFKGYYVCPHFFAVVNIPTYMLVFNLLNVFLLCCLTIYGELVFGDYKRRISNQILQKARNMLLPKHLFLGTEESKMANKRLKVHEELTPACFLYDIYGNSQMKEHVDANDSNSRSFTARSPMSTFLSSHGHNNHFKTNDDLVDSSNHNHKPINIVAIGSHFKKIDASDSEASGARSGFYSSISLSNSSSKRSNTYIVNSDSVDEKIVRKRELVIFKKQFTGLLYQVQVDVLNSLTQQLFHQRIAWVSQRQVVQEIVLQLKSQLDLHEMLILKLRRMGISKRIEPSSLN